MIPLDYWRSDLLIYCDLIGANSFVEWVRSHPDASFYDLWEEAIDPDWFTYLAIAGGATKEQLVFAGCAVARLCLHLIPEGDDRPRIAIETAEKWCRGEATAEQVKDARNLIPLESKYEVYYWGSTTNFNQARTVILYALRAGIYSQLICATLRKYLPFERPPRPKGLTVWQRLAKD